MRAWRASRFALHLLVGLAIALCAFPFMSFPRRRRIRQRWSRRLLELLGVRLHVVGAVSDEGSLLVANHVSWLDIFIINALAPAGFIAKSEIRNWPVIGWLAASNDTIFLQRGSRAHARWINHIVADRLAAGEHVALFPEGTTTDGQGVAHFHAMLLQPAIDAGHAVQALALRYRDTHDRYNPAPAYHGDISLGRCLAAILNEPEIHAEVHLAAVARPEPGLDRRDFARELRTGIATIVSAPGGQHTKTET